MIIDLSPFDRKEDLYYESEKQHGYGNNNRWQLMRIRVRYYEETF